VTPLNHSDAEVTLIFLSAVPITYGSPEDDPIFAAHNAYTVDNETYYYADDYVTVIGCVEQHEFCLTQDRSQGSLPCTDLSSEKTVIDKLEVLYNNSAMSDAQWDTADRILYSLDYATIHTAIESRLAFSLEASQSVYGGYQVLPLPNNQWQIEVYTWLTSALAYLQYTITQYASGQTHYNTSRIIQPDSAYKWTVCNQQIIKSSAGYQSFSFLGVALTIVLGTIIIIIGGTIDHIPVVLWRRKRHRDDRQIGQYCSKAWNLDNKFHLLRMALESESRDSWDSASDKEIPLTVRGENSEKSVQYFKIDAPGCQQL
jgi:hypothetical protein